jgi:hypothetical protein
MKTRIFPAAMIVLVCTLSCICSAAESNEASCIVKVTSDPTVLPVNINVIRRLILSDSVGGKAINDVLGTSDEPTDETAVWGAVNRVVLEQLAQVVDLSDLTEETTLHEAIEMLANSVEPQLPITVLWKDLRETAFIEPTTQIEITIPRPVSLRMGLKLVLQGACAGPLSGEVDYVLEDGAVKVATVDTMSLDYSCELFDVQDLSSAPPEYPLMGRYGGGPLVDYYRGGIGGPMMGAMDMGGGGMGGAMMGGMGAGGMIGGEHEEGNEKRSGAMMGSGMGGGMMPNMELLRRETQRPAPAESKEILLFQLRVTLKENNQALAAKLMNAVVSNLKDALNKAHRDYSLKFHGQLESAEREIHQAEGNFRQLQEQLRGLSGGRDLRRERISQDIEMHNAELEQERMQLELHRVSERDLSERIARVRDKAQDRVKEDVVTMELEEMIKRQMKDLENAKRSLDFKDDTRQREEEIREKIVRSRIELANQREKLRQSAGGELAFMLQDKIANLSTERNLSQARLAQIEERLVAAKELLAKADDFELLSIKADVARRDLQEVMELRNGLRRRIRMVQPPIVSVIDAE